MLSCDFIIIDLYTGYHRLSTKLSTLFVIIFYLLFNLAQKKIVDKKAFAVIVDQNTNIVSFFVKNRRINA